MPEEGGGDPACRGEAAVEQGPADWTMLKLSGWGLVRSSDRVSPGLSAWHEVLKTQST